MAELLKEAIHRLSDVVNPSTRITHSRDKSKAQELLLELHKEGETLTYEEVKMIALEIGWSELHADTLAKLAQHIDSGGHVVIENPLNWGEYIVSEIKKKLSDNT